MYTEQNEYDLEAVTECVEQTYRDGRLFGKPGWTDPVLRVALAADVAVVEAAAARTAGFAGGAAVARGTQRQRARTQPRGASGRFI